MLFINIFWIKRNRLKGGCFHAALAIACGCFQLSIYQVTGSDTILIDFFTGGKGRLVEIGFVRNFFISCQIWIICCIANLNALTRLQLHSIWQLDGKLAAIHRYTTVQIVPSFSAICAVSIKRFSRCSYFHIDFCILCILHAAAQFIFQNNIRHRSIFITGFFIRNGDNPSWKRCQSIRTNCGYFRVLVCSLCQTRSGLFDNLLQGQICSVGCNLARLAINQNFLFGFYLTSIGQGHRNQIAVFCILLLQHRCNFSSLGIGQLCGIRERCTGNLIFIRR